MKNELDRKTMTKFLTHDGSINTEAKHTKKCVIKQKLKFKDYKNCLEVTRLENELNYLEKFIIEVDSLKENQKLSIKRI